MSATTVPIHYPESDGEPMADNTQQLRWIFVLYGNLAALFRDNPDVFVGGNQFWYPVEGRPDVVVAPDVYVVFGRPKGDRPSYKQWEEDGVPMTVVFEVLSPKNTPIEMVNKLTFYEDHGAEEFYVFDPDSNSLAVYLRRGEILRRVRPVQGFVSPRLQIRFDLSGPEMTVFGPDGKPFLTFEQLKALQVSTEQERDRAQQERDRAQQKLARLTELIRKARRGEASAEEVQELDRLEQEE